MEQTIQVSNLALCFIYNGELRIQEFLNDFSLKADSSIQRKLTYRIRLVEQFDPMPARIIYQVPGRMVVMQDETGRLEYRVFFHPYTGQPYILYREMENGEILLDLVREVLPAPVVDEGLLENLALERHLLSDNSMILHSSSILVDGKAVLFTAPSGTGKSTQAELWRRYRGVKVINGDRNILHLDEEGRWMVHGIPFCGTSGIRENIRVPLGAIVRLKQGDNDAIEHRSQAQVVQDLYSESTVNSWNPNYIDKIVRMCERLATDTTNVFLSCTMEETAVECLEQKLKGRERA